MIEFGTFIRSFMVFSGIFLSESLSASQAQNYGLGGSSSGRAGSVTAETENPFAALYNPALMAAEQKPQFAFSSGIAGTRYSTLKNIRLERTYQRSPNRETLQGDYTLPENHLSLWALGYTYPFRIPFLSNRKSAVGLVASGPFRKLRTFSSSAPDDFDSLRYGTSDSQFKGTLSTSLELLQDRLFVGAGLSLYISAAGAAEMTVVSSNPTGRMALNVDMNSALVTGLFALTKPAQFGLVVRQQVNPTFEQSLTGIVQWGQSDIVSQPALVRSSLYYEPPSIELDIQYPLERFKLSAGIAYEIWTGYQPGYVTMEVSDTRGKVIQTTAPVLSMKNTVSPRLSLEVPTFGNKLLFSFGYQFRPTPITDLSALNNTLDSDTHLLGFSFLHKVSGETWPVELHWGLYAQYHWLSTRHIVKQNPEFIGSPEFDFSARAYSYGISVFSRL